MHFTPSHSKNTALIVLAILGTAAMGQPYQQFVLPYTQNALEPYLSARTVDFHYNKHHRGYIDKLNQLIAGTPWAGQPLERIIRDSQGQPDKSAIFNNAAQVWNHRFFWRCMTPDGGGLPSDRMLGMIENSFGSMAQFKETFLNTALAQFGSGWVWLIQDGDKLKIIRTANADTPIAYGQIPILTCDVWEHAYYLDYQNRRKDFVQAFLDHLVNWDFAMTQLQ